MEILIPASPGELLDKIAILEIKAERIRDARKLANVRAELAVLARARDTSLDRAGWLDRLAAALKSINAELWEIEDRIREHERRGDFGLGFVELARAVYRSNDRRAAIKREINVRLDSAIVEEKSYAAY
jgi:hypothetical protein